MKTYLFSFIFFENSRSGSRSIKNTKWALDSYKIKKILNHASLYGDQI